MKSAFLYYCYYYFLFFRWKNLVEAGGIGYPVSPEELEGEDEFVNV